MGIFASQKLKTLNLQIMSELKNWLFWKECIRFGALYHALHSVEIKKSVKSTFSTVLQMWNSLQFCRPLMRPMPFFHFWYCYSILRILAKSPEFFQRNDFFPFFLKTTCNLQLSFFGNIDGSSNMKSSANLNN